MDELKGIEPNVLRRKRLAIDVLKEIEAEEGHDTEKIGRRVKKEEIIKIARKLRKRAKKKIKEEKQEEVAIEVEERAS